MDKTLHAVVKGDWRLTFFFKDNVKSRLASFLTGGFILFVLFEAASFVCRLLIPFFPFILDESEKSIVFSLLNAETWLFFSSTAIGPVFALIWMFSWVVWPFSVFLGLFGKHKRDDLNVCNRSVLFKEFVKTAHSGLDRAFRPVRRGSSFLLVVAVSLMLVTLVTVYPYFPSLNSSGKFVGVDVPFYEWQLMELNSLGNLNSVVFRAFQFPDRPLSLLFLFLGWKVTGVSIRQATVISEVVLGLLLLLATYFFVRTAGFNSFYASLAMLFTVASYHVTVGMYGGLFANMVGLVFMYSFLGLVFACLRTCSWRLCLMAVVFQSLLLFSHANTWDMSMGIVGLFFLFILLEWLIKRKNSSRLLMLFAILVAGVSLNFVRNSVLHIGIGTVEAVGVAKSGVSLFNLLSVWQTLGASLGSFMGIGFVNPVLLFFAGLGGIAVALDSRLVSRFLTTSLVAASVPFILGDYVVQTRILYNLPVQVFAFLGLLALLSFVERFFSAKEAKRIGFLLVLLIIIVELNYVFRCSFYLTTVNFFPVH